MSGTGPSDPNLPSKVSVTQKLKFSFESTLEIAGASNLTPEQIDAIVNANALDISSIIASVLGGFNEALLGSTTIGDNLTVSGDTIVNNLDSTAINTGIINIGDEIVIGDNTSSLSLISRLESMETTISLFNNNLTDLCNNFNRLDDLIKVNDVSQTFFEIMTQQPYKFNTLGTPTEITTSTIKLTWNYDNILAKHNINNSIIYAKLANSSDNKLIQLP